MVDFTPMFRQVIAAVVVGAALAFVPWRAAAQSTPCTTSLDCPECAGCLSTGFCDVPRLTGGICMCNVECVAYGLSSCALDLNKPLCGGACAVEPPTEPLSCGMGADALTVEPLSLERLSSLPVAAYAPVTPRFTELRASSLRSSSSCAVSSPSTHGPRPRIFWLLATIIAGVGCFTRRRVRAFTSLVAMSILGALGTSGCSGEDIASTSDESCAASCANLEAVAPAVELFPLPSGESVHVGLHFARDTWFVAWGGRPETETIVQRIDLDGVPVSEAARYSGSIPMGMTGDDSTIVVWGWQPPAYTPLGLQLTVAQLDLELVAVLQSALVRTPNEVSLQRLYFQADDAHQLALIAGRFGGAVRWFRFRTLEDWHANQLWSPPDGPRWHLGALAPATGGSRLAVFGDGDAADLAFATAVDGEVTRTEPTPTLDLSGFDVYRTSEAATVAGNFWVVTWETQTAESRALLRGFDDAGAPISDTIEFALAGWSPEQLVDAAGTPLLVGRIDEAGLTRGLVVPIDVAAGRACRSKRLELDGNTSPIHSIRAIRFQGERAGILVETWGDVPEQRHLYFLQVACGER